MGQVKVMGEWGKGQDVNFFAFPPKKCRLCLHFLPQPPNAPIPSFPPIPHYLLFPKEVVSNVKFIFENYLIVGQFFDSV